MVDVFVCAAAVRGSVLPLRGPRPPGGHRQRLCLPQPQVQPPEEQQEHRLLQGQTHPERGEKTLTCHSAAASSAHNAAVKTTSVSPFRLQLTSQHPYAEVYIGQPHVWTVDIENPAEVERAIRSILSQKVTHHCSDIRAHVRTLQKCLDTVTHPHSSD